MAVEVTQYLRNKFSAFLQEADEEACKLPLFSRFRSIERQLNFMFENMTAMSQSNASKISVLLYSLIDSLYECQIRAQQGLSSTSNKSVSHCLRVNPVSELLFRKKMRRKLKEIDKLLNHVSLMNEREFRPERLVQQSYPIVDASRIVGFDSAARKIEDLLVKEIREKDEGGGFSSIGILGRCGCGKTALAQKLFASSRIRSEFSPMIWVCLTNMLKDERIDMRSRVLKYMLEELGQDISELEYAECTIVTLLEKLQRGLMGKKYLIVLDDAWCADDWYADLSYRLPRGYPVGEHFSHGLPKGSGGAVIVTSRREKVTRKMVGSENLIQLEPELNNQICWEIFSHEINRRGIFDLSHGILNQMEEEIIRNCDRLPLAARTLAEIVPTRFEYHS